MIVVIWIVTFLVSLPLSSLALAYHQSAWFGTHPQGPQTEEDMLALGDYPNVTAGWIGGGWIPPTVGIFFSKFLVRGLKPKDQDSKQ